MTLDLYGHLFENRLDEVAERLDAAARADAAVARVLPKAHMVTLDSTWSKHPRPINTGLPAVPPARIELATPGLGVRRSIP